MSQLDRHLELISAHQRQFDQAELALEQEAQQIAKAERELPRKEGEIRRALDEADNNIAKLEGYARNEAAQRGDVDREVEGRAAEIEKSSRELAKQAREGHDNFSKWVRATRSGVTNAIEGYERSLEIWWRDTRFELIDSAVAGNRRIVFNMFKAFNALQRALMGMSAGKYHAPAYIQFSAVGGPPNRDDISTANKRASEVEKKYGTFREQVKAQERKNADAGENLLARRDGAHAKIKAGLEERAQQLSQWHDRREQLKVALEQLAQRKVENDEAKQESARRAQDIARARGQLNQAMRGGGRRGGPPIPKRD